MEIGMRWIYQQITDNKGIPVESGQRPGFCFKARKNMLCVVAGHPVRIIKRNAADFDKLRVVINGDKTEYSLKQAVAQFRAIAGRNGITAGAQRLLDEAERVLQRAKGSAKGVELNEDEFQDEEGVSAVQTDTTDPTTTTTEEKPVATTKTKRAKKATKAKANGNGHAKAAKGPSRISRAVEFMREEIKKEGGQKALERGFRKELFERAAKKFDLSPATCGIQYNKQVLNKAKTSAG